MSEDGKKIDCLRLGDGTILSRSDHLAHIRNPDGIVLQLIHPSEGIEKGMVGIDDPKDVAGTDA
jgi:hypothetical protein